MDEDDEIDLQRRKKRDVYCGNCDEKGHYYRQCKKPITSFGIACFRRNEKDKLSKKLIETLYENEKEYEKSNNEIPLKMVMVQRKNTMGYVDFLRGRYSDEPLKRKRQLVIFLEEMIPEERYKLLSWSFDDLWDDLWINHNAKCYKNEYTIAKNKFNMLNIKELLQQTSSKWSYTEWGIPKGRKAMKEMSIECAKREFEEETGYTSKDYFILDNSITFEEVFTGTNGVEYKHVYYIGKMNSEAKESSVDKTNMIQIGEIKDVSWFTENECIRLTRPYDVEKKSNKKIV